MKNIISRNIAYAFASLYLIASGLSGQNSSAPGWWPAPAIMSSATVETDSTPVTIGQLKQVAIMAREHFDWELRAIGGALDLSIIEMIDGFKTKVPGDLAQANLEQVKAVAKPFHDRLIAIHHDVRQNFIEGEHPFFGDSDTLGPESWEGENMGLVTMRQLKVIFGFDVSGFDTSTVDTAGNGLPDWWEYQYFGYIGVDAGADPDGDGLTNLDEYVMGTDPLVESTFPMEIDETSQIESLPAALDYLSWMNALEGPDAVPLDQRGPGHSPSGDSLSNVWKFAFGLKPMTHYPPAKRYWSTTVIDPFENGSNDHHLAVVYHRKIDPGYIPLVRIEAYAASGFPLERLPCPISLYRQSGFEDEGWEQVVLVDETANADMRFMQMRFTLVASELETIGGLRHWLSADFDTDEFVSLDQEGRVIIWGDRGPGGKDLAQEDPLLRPSFTSGIAHPSGRGALSFDGSGQFLVGEGFLDDAMKEIALAFVWEPHSLQDAVLWQHAGIGGDISLKLEANGAYGLAVNGTLTEQAHSYQPNEAVVSLVVLSRNPVSGELNAALYHNGHGLQGASRDAGIVTFGSEDIVMVGAGSSAGGFDGQLRDVLLYNSCFDLGEVEILTDEFEKVYNLNLNRAADELPAWWKLHYFETLDVDPDEDYDGDGFTNLQEFMNGTNPLDYYNGRLPVIEIVAGDNQTISAGSHTFEAFQIQILDGETGAPLTNGPVRFEESTNYPGLVFAPFHDAEAASSLDLRTDSFGMIRTPFASVFFRGSDIPGKQHLVKVTAGQSASSFSVQVSSEAGSQLEAPRQVRRMDNGDGTITYTWIGSPTVAERFVVEEKNIDGVWIKMVDLPIEEMSLDPETGIYNVTISVP